MSYVKKGFELFILFIRWILGGFRSTKGSPRVNAIKDCHFIYINLLHRTDRKSQILSEFEKIGVLSVERFNAFKNDVGILGCAMSHKGAVERAKEASSLVVICEDDAMFIESNENIDHILKEFSNNRKLDVLCLAFNDFNRIKISKDFFITSDCQTMACYVIKPYVYDELIAVLGDSVKGLREGKSHDHFANDILWKRLQKKYFFALPVRRLAIQRPSYSDILNTNVAYNL